MDTAGIGVALGEDAGGSASDAPAQAVRVAATASRHTTRALLRRLTETVTAGRPLSARQLAEFNVVIGATPVRAALVRDGDGYAIEMTPVSSSWLEVTIRAVAGSVSAMLRADPSRLRVCAAPGCDTVFWDDTRSRTRIWCDSRTCGNRIRVSRHRDGAV